MPAGPDALGLVYFAATKFAGYTAYCRWAIQPRAAKVTTSIEQLPNAWKAGAWRTLIGLGIGTVVGFGFWRISSSDSGDSLANFLFFALLIPVRVFEWLFLLQTSYRSISFPSRSRNTLVAGGIVASFSLDAAGIIAAFVLPGGMWVC